MGNAEKFGFVCAVMTVAIAFIAYVTPYWTVKYVPELRKRVNLGLLAHCEPDTCDWFLSKLEVQDALPGKSVNV